MILAQALRLVGAGKIIEKPPRLAFVGAGGKTTLMFSLAAQLLAEVPAVWVTTTTHLGTWQAILADHHLRIDMQSDLTGIPSSGIILFTGGEVESGRLGGLDAAALEHLLHLADGRGLPLLVEADGSRRLPLKAPAGHEPVIPAWVDTVAVVAGLSGVGQSLEKGWVHRPERFAALAELAQGQPVTEEALSRVLTHPLGGLKAIPSDARRVLLLNQADTPELRQRARCIARRCLPAYAVVLVSGFEEPLNSAPSIHSGQAPLPEENRLTPFPPSPSPLIFSAHELCAVILLAAGASRRFGTPKQLVDWQGQPLVRHMARLALESGAGLVRVVTGAGAGLVQGALDGLPVEIIFNSDWETGQASSLRRGLSGLPAETGAALFLLVDQPQVPVSLLKGLFDLHAGQMLPITAPCHDGRRLNPVLFDRVTFPRLMSLEGDVGGRALFAEYPAEAVAWLSWDSPELLQDFDTPEELEQLKR